MIILSSCSPEPTTETKISPAQEAWDNITIPALNLYMDAKASEALLEYKKIIPKMRAHKLSTLSDVDRSYSLGCCLLRVYMLEKYLNQNDKSLKSLNEGTLLLNKWFLKKKGYEISSERALELIISFDQKALPWH